MEQSKLHNDKKYGSVDTLWPFLKRLFGLVKERYPKYFWGLIISVGIVAIADGYFPMIWKDFLDDLIYPTFKLIEADPSVTIESVIPWGTGKILLATYVAWTLIMAIGVLLFIWFAEQIKERIIYDLRSMMFRKLQFLSFSYYDKNSTGWLVSRITSDADRVTELISWGFVSFVWGISMIFIAFGWMAYLDYRLAGIVLVTIPSLLFVSIKIRLLVLKYSRSARKQNSEMTAYVTEHINGVEVNKATVQENSSIDAYGNQVDKMRFYAFKSSYYTAMYMPLVFLTGSIAAAMVIMYGGHLHIALGALTIGSWAAFFGYSRFIFEPIFDISRFYALAQDSLSAGERIFSLIDEVAEIRDGNSVGDFNTISGSVEFKDVDFHYNPEKTIFEKFNLKIEPGESLALVGPTGHGKTTITSLLGRFYEPVSGAILVDGVDYKSKSLKSFRSQLGIILQEPHLFSGTVRQNILFGLRRVGEDAKRLPNDEQIIMVLTEIGATELIEKLDIEVGESGKNLSNGERQLVSFARAIIKNPAILIMDEATSSIDTMTEARIQLGIKNIIKNRTSIIIAHRLSTIKNCDKIAVIEHGKISEIGTHRELLEGKGHYYELFMKQKRAFSKI